MKELLPDLENWLAAGEPVAMATVIRTWGSAPRRPGARMALTESGHISGSVSGGCVEAAVFQAGVECLQNGHPRLLQFHVGDESAWEVGLACGGSLDVWVAPLDPHALEELAKCVHARRPVAHVLPLDPDAGPELVVSAEDVLNGDPDSPLASGALPAALEALLLGRPMITSIETRSGPAEAFIDVILPAPSLVMVGGAHIARALSELASVAGYHTVLVDPRRLFGNSERFPGINRLLQLWPEEAFEQIELDEQTAVCTLTHDPKIDDPALRVALSSPAFYVGALGSRKTQSARHERLQAMGLTAQQIARLHGPVGLNIGAETPEEIALSIMAEIVSAYRGRGARVHPAALEEGV